MAPSNYTPTSDEALRLEALRHYDVLDTPPEREFDHIVELAADLFRAPIALISFVADKDQYFKARVGLDVCGTSREVSFCTHALFGDEVFVVADARKDKRFKHNALVTGEPFIRFYAGAPLRVKSGVRLGSLCIIDREPRPDFSERDKHLLQTLARLVVDQLELRPLLAMKQAALRLSSATPDAIVCIDKAAGITFWNRAAEVTFGFSRAEILGERLSRVLAPHVRLEHERRIAALLAGETLEPAGIKPIETTGLRRDGTEFPLELSGAAWREERGSVQVGFIIRDVSERSKARERLSYLTSFDRLTGLPNRPRFLEMMAQRMARQEAFAILKVGLDKFKHLNAAMGLLAGDMILQIAAERVVEAVGADASVARLGADEFGVLMPGCQDPTEAGALAERALAGFQEPFLIDGSKLHVEASIGLALYPGFGEAKHADDVLKSALLALHQAKQDGGARYALYRPYLALHAQERRRVEEELRVAYEQNQFELHYQPQIRLSDRRIMGAEALIRWRHPERGLLPPSGFIPVLETSVAAVPVGNWIIRTAVGFAAGLARAGTPIRIGINLFAAQLRGADLVATIDAALHEHRLPPEFLEIEITETTVLKLEDSAIAPLRDLRERGIGIAFDDYGTGYASLSLLKRYPLTRLKIDREFIRDLETDPDDASIVKAVLALGHNLGLHVTGEGIETPAQAEFLLKHGCGEAQGYLFAKPMPAAELRQLLGRRRSLAA